MGFSIGIDVSMSSLVAIGGLQSLFANGENGFLFDPASDLSRLFTTTTGNANVVSNNDPVGLWLDNHGWAGRSTDQQIAAQPELCSDPGFNTGGGWSIQGAGEGTQIAGGLGTIKTLTNTYTGLNRGGFTIGKTYCVEWDIMAVRAGAMRIDGVAGTSGPSFTTTGRKRVIGVAVAAVIGFVRNAATTDIDIDNVSIKEIPGNHGAQATGVRRPFWKANGGKPYLACDGSDDCLVPPAFAPRTLVFAGRMAGADGVFQVPIGVNGAGNSRVRINRETNGDIGACWGTGTTFGATSVGALGTPFVAALTGDTSSADFYINAGLVGSQASAGLGPDGAAGPALGCWNNNGTPASHCACDAFAALALDRRVTPAEIARITSIFQQRF